MKQKYIIMVGLVVALSLVWGCEKNKREVYDTEFSALNVWFGKTEIPEDSVVYNYAYRSLTAARDSISFYARLAGVPATVDRSFKLRVVDNQQTKIREGVHFEFGNYVLKAGEIRAVCSIYIKSSDDFSADGQNHTILFELEETAAFHAGVKEYTTMKLVMRDKADKPTNWDADAYPYMPLRNYFGTYSRVKHQFMISVLPSDLPAVFRVIYQQTPTPPYEIPLAYAQYLQRRCQAALAEYNAAHPTAPLRDENDELISF